MRVGVEIGVVLLFVASAFASIGARAQEIGGGGLPMVSIYDVKIDRNSMSGDRVQVTWKTSPPGATDQFLYKPKSATSWTPIKPNCPGHCVVVTGLTIHADYDFQIWSSYPYYIAGGYVGVFYPTDVSLSPVYENYRVDYDPHLLWPCGVMQYYPKAFMAGDVVHRLKSANPADWTAHYIYTHIDAHDPSGCAGMRHTTISVFAVDDTQPFNTKDVWMQGLDVFPRSELEFAMGTMSYSITFGAEYKGVGGSVSGQWSCPSPSCVHSYQKWWGAQPYPDGSILVGQTSIEWEPTSTNSLDVVFMLKVRDMLAQKHYTDKLRFVVVFDLVINQHGALLGFIGDYWVPFGEQRTSYTIVLGDGKVNDPNSGSADQFTDLQDGTQTVEWKP